MNLRRLIVVFGAILFLWNLWGYDLWAPDEPYFAEGAREMIVDGHWVVPHVNGVITTDKPPLFFWTIALLSLPVGAVTSLTARFPSVLAAIGTLWLTVRLGRRLWGERAGALAGLLLMLNYLFWDKARSAQTDSLLCFLILVALSAFEAFRAGDADGRRAGALFGLACGLAVLTKGPVGLLIPLGIVIVTLATDRRLGRLKRFAPVIGPLVLVATLACWVVPASLWDPDRYSVVSALKEHFVDRAMQGMHHHQPFWYYLKVLPVQLMPWSGLVPGALLLAWRRRTPGDRLLLVVVVFVVLFFSASTEKRDLYVLPAYPAFALLVAALLDTLSAGRATEERNQGGVSRRWITVPQAITGILFCAAGVGLWLASGRVEVIPPWMILVTGGLILLPGAGAVATALRGRARASMAVTLTGIAAAYLFVSTAVFPALDPFKSARAFSLEMKQHTADSRLAGHEVVAYRLYNLPEAFALYSNGVYLRETWDAQVLADHLTQPAKVYAVVDLGDLDAVPADVSARMVEVVSRRLSRMRVSLVHNGGGVDGADLGQH